MEELWKRSISIPWLSISNMGRFLIDPYDIEMPNGGTKRIQTKPTLGSIVKSGNHLRRIYCNRKYKISKKAHVLIAETWLGDKPSINSVVMHLNDDATDNRVENLKWGSQKENMNSEAYIAYCKTRLGDLSPPT